MKKQNSGQGMLLGMVLASVITAIVVAGGVKWYLSLNQDMSHIYKSMQEATLFYDQGNRIKNIDYNAIKEQEGTTSVEIAQGYKITKKFSNEGVFKDGKCDTTVQAKELKNAVHRCIEAEMTLDDPYGNRLKEATFTRHSSQMSSAPIGTITTYDGDIADLPEGWHICDGTDGTPDMTDKFIQGTTSQNEIGTIAGQNWYQLQPSVLPETQINIKSNTTKIFDGGHAFDNYHHTFDYQPDSNLHVTGTQNVSYCILGMGVNIHLNFPSAEVKVDDWKGEPIETQPPYKKIIYIMRVK